MGHDHLGQLDILIVALAVLLLFVISYVFGRRERDTADYFLGQRRIPWPVACLSFVATEISALTIMGFPATAYAENWEVVQFFLGSAVARLVVAHRFIPAYYHHGCTSIYEFLGHRFGPTTQIAGAGFFFVTRLIASGVRLYAACLGVSLILGWSLAATLLCFTVVSIVFIAFGGIKAVVWAGAYQALAFIVAGLALAAYLASQVQGGLAAAWDTAAAAGRLSMVRFTGGLNDPTTFWAGGANAFFIGLAAFGTDQENVQRLLTVKNARLSQRTLVSTLVTVIPVMTLYLAIGTLLFVFYQQHPDVPAPARAKEVLSHFVAHSLPFGLRGLLLAAIVLASIDSPLSSLSASFVTDLYRPWIRRNASERHYLAVGRAGVVAFGLLLGLIAWACEPVANVLWFAFQIFSLTGGAILGVFLLGLFTDCRADRLNVLAMVGSTVLTTALLLLERGGHLALAWSWLIVIGTAATMGVSLLGSRLLPTRPSV